MRKLTCSSAIKKAEKLLPGIPAEDNEDDARWQAIIEIGEFIYTHPEPIWEFIAVWGQNQCQDLRGAVATCLLEHLLEFHFIKYFPRVKALAIQNANFADTFLLCWPNGDALEKANEREWKKLQKEIEAIHNLNDVGGEANKCKSHGA